MAARWLSPIRRRSAEHAGTRPPPGPQLCMGSLPRKTATAQIPNTQPLNFLGSCSLVGIGKFDLLFLWLIGVVRTRSILNPRPSTLSETHEQEKDHEMICVAVFPCSPYRYYSTKNYTPKHYDMIKQKRQGGILVTDKRQMQQERS